MLGINQKIAAKNIFFIILFLFLLSQNIIKAQNRSIYSLNKLFLVSNDTNKVLTIIKLQELYQGTIQ